MIHSLAYMTPAVWKRARSTKSDFWAFGSNSATLGRMDRGDTLWVMTTPKERQGYFPPPTLAARLQARRVVDTEAGRRGVPSGYEQYRYVLLADERSSFYLRTNYVFRTLFDLYEGDRGLERYEARAAKTSGEESPYSLLPGYFQAVRRINLARAQKFEDFADAVSRGRTVFLSYKHADMPWARELADALQQLDVVCWWDRWMIPKLEEETQYVDSLMTAMLNDAIVRSRWFVALVTDGFLTKPRKRENVWWPDYEWQQAVKTQRTRRLISVRMTRYDDRYEQLIGPSRNGAHEIDHGPRQNPRVLAEQIEEIIGSVRERGLPGQVEPHQLTYS